MPQRAKIARMNHTPSAFQNLPTINLEQDHSRFFRDSAGGFDEPKVAVTFSMG